MQELLIDKIRTDGGVQSRKRINEEYVQEICDNIKAGKKYPPIEVYNDGSDIWCADGFHRILGHVRADKRTIKCDVHKGSKIDAIWHSCGANQAHGLRRTNEDKNHAVGMALEANPKMSNRAIADHVGVDESLVRSAKARCGLTAPPHSEVLGKDGKTHRIPPPSGKPKAPPSSSPKPLPPPAPKQHTSHPPPVAPKVTNPTRLDDANKPIPDHLWPLWDRGAEMKEMAATVSGFSGTIRKMHDDGDPLLLDGNGQSIIAALETAKTGLKANIPHAVCPYCRGMTSDTCKACKGRGLVGKFYYDTAIPKEMKL